MIQSGATTTVATQLAVVENLSGFLERKQLQDASPPNRRERSKEVLNERLMDEILGKENLIRAHQVVKSNRGAPGVDGLTVDAIKPHLQEHWPSIKAKLLSGDYKPARVKGVTIPKPNGGERQLGIPTVLDRIIGQAISQKLSPIWEPMFSDHSYGYRPCRSAHDAVRKAQSYVAEGKSWVVDLDIKEFFNNVNHDILMHQIGQKVRDKRVLQLIGRYLRAGIEMNGTTVKRTKGTPQGGTLSPLLANIYLDPLDKELERRGLSFVRYADDVNVYVSSERSAKRIMESICKWIEKHLKLEVNRDKSDTDRPSKRKFLGFTICEDASLKISRSSLVQYKNKVRTLWTARQSRTSQELVTQWSEFIRGWWNYYKISGSKLVSLSSWTRRHIRKCFWQRWHCRKGRIAKLKSLGIKAWQIKRTAFHGGAWRAAKQPAMHMGLTNATLRKYGLLTPHDLATAE